MEKDNYICLGDSHIQKEGVEKEVISVTDDVSKGRIMMVLFTKSSLKAPLKVTKKNLKKYIK